MKRIVQLLLVFIASTPIYLTANTYEIIEVYTQDELNVLIYNNKHLQRVKEDDCQLLEDIEAHALKVKEPTYVFLWGDMLAWGVCVERNAALGMFYIKEAAQQGLLPAIEQLGRYYNQGTLVTKDKKKAIKYFREAALQGHLGAQINYVTLLNQGYGSPKDYQDAYHVLYNSIIESPKKRQHADQLLEKLAKHMPTYAVEQAQRDPQY